MKAHTRARDQGGRCTYGTVGEVKGASGRGGVKTQVEDLGKISARNTGDEKQLALKGKRGGHAKSKERKTSQVPQSVHDWGKRYPFTKKSESPRGTRAKSALFSRGRVSGKRKLLEFPSSKERKKKEGKGGQRIKKEKRVS